MPLTYPTVDAAIAQFEGANTFGTIANRQNNPGDLAYGSFAVQHGAIFSGTNGIAIFPNMTTGQAAEDALVTHYADAGATLSDLINAWAPPNANGNSPQATQNYLDFVTGQVGAKPTTLVKDLAATGTSTNPSTDGIASKVADTLKTLGIDAIIPGYAAAKAYAGDSFAGLSWSRIAAFLLGLLFIGAGLYLLKPVQNVVTTTIKHGTKLATEAAIAA